MNIYNDFIWEFLIHLPQKVNKLLEIFVFYHFKEKGMV